jgi:hypothetical protein
MDTHSPLPPAIWDRTPPEAQAYILHLEARVAALEASVQAAEGRLTLSQTAELLDMSAYDVQRKTRECGFELGATADQYRHALETARQLRPQRKAPATP